MTKIAFIGLGHMGVPMVVNLMAAGHDVVGFYISPLAIKTATDKGIAIAGSAEVAVAKADMVFTMLQSGKQVLSLYNSGLLQSMRQGTLMIDTSTIDVISARSANELATANGMKALDAPVSGGVSGASAATLTFMVGGSADNFEQAKPVLQAMGRKIVHCGGSGHGQVAKICNNMVLGISMIAISEGFVLSQKLGLSPQSFYDVATSSSAKCWALDTWCPVAGIVPTSPVNNDFKPGFSTYLMYKDLKLAKDCAAAINVDLKLGSMAEVLYKQFIDDYGSEIDCSAIIKQIADNSE